ncbi:MAG: glycoside hydrolase family 2 protein [Candidatus Hydrogenedentes bacterium]|nr:glycoside hydrolase family 2 protein [Candidatus Hydrogenedentota bacterium]
MREVASLNRDWLFWPYDTPSAKRRVANERAMYEVCLPHSNVYVPWHNFDDKIYQRISWYRRHIKIPARWRNRRLRLTFDGVMIAADVWINGKPAGAHKGGYTPFTLDITSLVEFGKDNVISVRVDSTERADIPPCGGVIDYLTFGGIYRDVRLTVSEPVYIADVFVRPGARSLSATVTVANDQAYARETEVVLALGGKTARETVIIAPGERRKVDFALRNLTVRVWDLETPNLYDVTASLDNGDRVVTRVGFRQARFETDGKFYLNGKHVQLFGLDRHQTFPFLGGAAPARLQRRDADILKRELGLNIVRTSHYPQSPHFLDRCDEIGLLVFEEIPGWTHIGDAAWKEVSKQELREMIVRDRNHPSIVLWGVRINESADDHDYYTDTNRIAHELDPTRQTGGVRCFRESEMLEDVFTYNDFSNGVQPPNHRPYLITEFNGHMFPTKPFDQEERMVEHALRHARIQDAQMGTPGIAGAIGWCAFDYNTHRMFGSGDRVCYHGVMDIFRFPKFAAYFYKSQLDPKRTVVLEPASLMKQGERSGGGVSEMVVFSNCEEVAVCRDGVEAKPILPDRAGFPNLPHPPFRVPDPESYPWITDFEIVGKIGGKIVARKKIAVDGIPDHLSLTADAHTLAADGSDCTRIAFALTDRYGNIQPYATGVVELTVTGPATLIGENPFALVAGRGAVWLRAGQEEGLVKVEARTPYHKIQTVKIHVK